MWVPALMIIERKLFASLLGWKTELAGSGFDPDAAAPPDEPPAQAFLRALIHALEARSVDRSVGQAEIAARRQMKRTAPALLRRYL